MDMKIFNETLRKTFKLLQFKPNKLLLNGSFQSSYWATDIDLYEAVDCKHTSKLLMHLQSLHDMFMVSEIKVKTGKTSKKYKVVADIPQDCQLEIEMVKVDILLTEVLPYPIECTVIYDFNPGATYDINHVTEQMMDDVNSKGKFNILKKIKRIKSLFALHGFDQESKQLEAVTENTRIGLMNLSRSRIKLLAQKRTKELMSTNQMDMVNQWIREDLRKIGVTVGNLDSVLKKEVKIELKKLLA